MAAVVAGALALTGVGSALTWDTLSPVLSAIALPELGSHPDYEGEGEGEKTVKVPEGSSGYAVGKILEENGVVASAEAFNELARLEPRIERLQPGTYVLKERMSSVSAIEGLLDDRNLRVDKVTVPEGQWVSETFDRLAKETGEPRKDYDALEPQDVGLPKEAGGELEGWLFPSTYNFDVDDDARTQVRKMVEQTTKELEREEVPRKEWERTLTVASIVEGESSGQADRGKVSSVVLNRLDQDMELGMDSTVHFVHQERGRAGTTKEQRESKDPYNTYVHKGLPPGPINSPGRAAIQAANDPDDTDYLYFVTVNPVTGETKFSRTFTEHQRYVGMFNRWCQQNEGQC
ncbi:endolytic transglycosylase MltG [Kytococcus sp. Marseille-QA3725]